MIADCMIGDHLIFFDPPAGKLVFSAAKAAENTLFSCRHYYFKSS
jgi:hypothetical protein